MARVKFTVNGAGINAGGKVTADPGAIDEANLRLPTRTAPTSPVSGDIWNQSGTLKFYNGTATKDIAFTDSNITGSAAKWTTARTITLGGDLSGSVSIDGSANVTLTATVAADSVALGTDTTGNYIATIAGTTDQVNVTGSGSETAAVTLSLPQSIASTSSPSFAGLTLSGDLAVNGADITTTSTGTATLFNTNATTVNVAGAATTVSIGAGSGTTTVNNALVVQGNLTVNGTTTTVNSTTISSDDPIITLGGDTAPTSDDNKDRGVEFRWHNGTSAKVGFFGYDDSTGKFTFIPDATNTSEVFSGTKGTLDVGSVESSTLFVDGIEVDTTGALNNQALVYNGTKFVPTSLSSNNAFTTFAVSGHSDVVADSGSDTLTFAGGTGITLSTNATTDTITVTNSGVTSIAGTANQITASAASGAVTLSLPSSINVNTTGTAAAWTTARTITLGGDLSGSVSIDGSANVTLTATVAADSVALGTDTTGNFVAGITGTANQITVTGSGAENASVSLSLPQDIATSSTPTFAALNVSDGSLNLQSDFDSTTTTSITAVSVKSVSATTYRSAKYVVQVVQGTNYMVTEILAIHDGTNVSYTEYGTITIGSAPASFDVDINAGNLRLLATPASASSTTFRVHSIVSAA